MPPAWPAGAARGAEAPRGRPGGGLAAAQPRRAGLTLPSTPAPAPAPALGPRRLDTAVLGETRAARLGPAGPAQGAGDGGQLSAARFGRKLHLLLGTKGSIFK